MREKEDELKRRDIKLAVVTFENNFFARQYALDHDLNWPLLIDEDRTVYRQYGMIDASFWDIWGIKTWWVYLKALAAGKKLSKSSGDVYQQGGDVLIDKNGIIRMHHVGQWPGDRPTIEKIFMYMGK